MDGKTVGLKNFATTIATEATMLTMEAGKILIDAENIQKKYETVANKTTEMRQTVESNTAAATVLSRKPTREDSNSSVLFAKMETSMSALNTTIEKINTGKQAVDFSSMKPGTIQVVVDGNAIASELKFIKTGD